jgi:D-3-phosphoglycerate dehydrogenase
MARIQTFNKIAPEGLAILEDRGHTVGPEIDDPDAILVRSAKLHEIEFGPSLKAIGRAGAGVNNVPVDRCTELKESSVFNTPGIQRELREGTGHVAGLMLSSRKIIGGYTWVPVA